MNSFKFNTKTWPLYYAMHSLPFPNGDEMCLHETIIWSATLHVSKVVPISLVKQKLVTFLLKGFPAKKFEFVRSRGGTYWKVKIKHRFRKEIKHWVCPFSEETCITYLVCYHFKLERKHFLLIQSLSFMRLALASTATRLWNVLA